MYCAASLVTNPFLLLQIGLFQQYPQLKQCVKPSLEKAVQDLLLPVAERSIKIAVTTTDSIIRKVKLCMRSLIQLHSLCGFSRHTEPHVMCIIM